MLGVIWRWRIWVQDVWGIVVFKKSSEVFNSIWIVDVTIDVIWKESNEQLLFAIQKGTGSGTRHKDINIAFNKNTLRYESLG